MSRAIRLLTVLVCASAGSLSASAESLWTNQAANVAEARSWLDDGDSARAIHYLEVANRLGTRGWPKDGVGAGIAYRELVLADWLQRRGEPLEALAALWEFDARGGMDLAWVRDERSSVERRILGDLGGRVPDAVLLHAVFEVGTTDWTPRMVELNGLELQVDEVSRQQWLEVMGWSRHCQDMSLEPRPADPVACIDAFDALHFANRVSVLAGLEPVYAVSADGVIARPGADGYRLPSPDEWRRLSGITGWSGRPRDLCDHANVLDRSARPLRRKQSERPFRCVDGSVGPEQTTEVSAALNHVLGNVSEWTWDDGGSGVAGWSWRDGQVAGPVLRDVSPNSWSDGTGLRLWRTKGPSPL